MPSGRIKVLYVSAVAERGGAEAVLLDLLKFHDRRAFDPVVCCLKHGPLVSEITRLGVRTFVVESGRIRQLPRTLAAVRRLRQLIASEQVDIVCSNMATGHLFGGLAAVSTRALAVWFQHGIPSGGAVDWLTSLIPSELIFVNSNATAAAQAKLPRCRGKLQRVDLGVDTTRFAPAGTPSGALLRVDLGVPDGGLLIAVIARLQRWKGQDVFLQAAARVAAEYPETRFLVVGDTLFGREPEYRRDLERLAATLGISSRVIFTGFRDDVPQLLDAVDIVVQPHRLPEPFGLAVVEAMSMQKAVIASNIGGPAEIIEDGKTGLLVPPDDVDALAQAVVRLIRNAQERCALGREARAAVQRRFTAERMTMQLESSFRSLLN